MAAESEEFRYDGEGDYVEHRRQKAVYDAKEMARDVILEAKRQHSRGNIPVEALQTDARSAVETYITEIEQMAKEAGADDLLNEALIHKVRISPPEELVRYSEGDQHRVISDPPQPKPAQNGTIQGLWGFLTAPEEFVAEWTIQVDVAHEGPQSITATSSTRMPVEASMDAFRHANVFLKRVGLELEPRMSDYDGGDTPGL